MSIPYRNITCDPINPRTQLDWTAVGVLDALNSYVPPVYTADVDASIVASGGRLARKAEAIKALRNIGYAIISTKARQNSWYMLAGTPDEYEIHRGRVVREAFSAQVSICRELDGAVQVNPTDIVLANSLRSAHMTAITLGTDSAVGMTLAEVVAELAPLVP